MFSNNGFFSVSTNMLAKPPSRKCAMMLECNCLPQVL